MLKNNGGDRVGKGTYWNLNNGERIRHHERRNSPRRPESNILPYASSSYYCGCSSIGACVRSFFAFHRHSDGSEVDSSEDRGRGAGDSPKQCLFWMETE